MTDLWMTGYDTAALKAALVLRHVLGLSEREAVELAKSVPCILKENISYGEAELLKRQLLTYKPTIPVYSEIVLHGEQPETGDT